MGKADEEPSAMECIDLNDPVNDLIGHDKRQPRDIPDSPAMSDRTEFEDPDVNGRSRKKKDLSGVLKSVSTIGNRLGKKTADVVHRRKGSQKGAIFIIQCFATLNET